MRVCYISSNAVDTEIDALFSSLRELSEGSKPILIMGDFNYVVLIGLIYHLIARRWISEIGYGLFP